MSDVTDYPRHVRPLEEVVAAAQQGDRQATAELVARLLPDLRAYVRLKSDVQLRNHESCSDLVQSVCREVLEDLHSFESRGAGSFRAWVFTAALNKVRQKYHFHRMQKRDVTREVSLDRPQDDADLRAALRALQPSPSEFAMAHEQAQRIEAAMDQLPESQREVLLLTRLVGLGHREVAERMGKSEGAVRVLLNRARVRLLAALEGRI